MSGLRVRPICRPVEADGLTLGIVATRWHAELVDHMVDRAEAAAKACGVAEVTVVRVPGSVELPVVAQALASGTTPWSRSAWWSAASTPHFDYVCDSVTDGLTRVALDAGEAGGARRADRATPIEQARDRAGLPGSAEDKGWAATVAALATALTLRELRAPQRPTGFTGGLS